MGIHGDALETSTRPRTLDSPLSDEGGPTSVAAPDPMPFDESVDILRDRIRTAEALDDSAIPQFKELMSDYTDRLPDGWYWEAYEELEALGHLGNVSSKLNGGDAMARLSADGRAYLRAVADE